MLTIGDVEVSAIGAPGGAWGAGLAIGNLAGGTIAAPNSGGVRNAPLLKCIRWSDSQGLGASDETIGGRAPAYGCAAASDGPLGARSGAGAAASAREGGAEPRGSGADGPAVRMFGAAAGADAAAVRMVGGATGWGGGARGCCGGGMLSPCIM